MRHIRNIYKYLAKIQNNSSFYIAHYLEEHEIEILDKIGFSKEIIENEIIIPNSQFNFLTYENVNGKEIIRKDLPQDEKYYQYVHWKTKDWGGYEHEGHTYVEKKRYRREYTIPFNTKIMLMKNENGQIYIISEMLKKDETNSELIKFVMNLFLSIFDDFVVLNDSLKVPAKINKLNFTFLRPGTYTRDEIKEHIKIKNKDVNDIENIAVYERFDYLNGFNETGEIMIGNQSFHGYYAIKTKKYWVLESNYTNNATYLFDDNWEEYVKLTKQEVINNNLCIQRLYHNENWKRNIRRLLS